MVTSTKMLIKIPVMEISQKPSLPKPKIMIPPCNFDDNRFYGVVIFA